jgi:hypothetical protein
MDNSIYLYLSLLLAPISSVVAWVAARNKRKNEETNQWLDTIDRLQRRQAEMTDEILKLQRDNIHLQKEIARLMSILTPEQLLQYQQLTKADNE